MYMILYGRLIGVNTIETQLSDISNLRNGQRSTNGCECYCSHCFTTQKRHVRSNNRDGKAAIPSVVLSTKDFMLLPIGEAKYNLFSAQRGSFGCKILKHVEEKTLSATQLWVTLSVTHRVKAQQIHFSLICHARVLPKFLKRIAKEHAKILLTSAFSSFL